MDPLPPHLSLNNLAEKFFAEMTEKDGGTYDALIQGLIKVEPYLHYTTYICLHTAMPITMSIHYTMVSILYNNVYPQGPKPYLHYTTVSSIEQCLHYKAVSILSTLKAQNHIYTIQQCLHYNYVYLEC